MHIEFRTLAINGLEHFVLDMGDDTLETLHVTHTLTWLTPRMTHTLSWVTPV